MRIILTTLFALSAGLVLAQDPIFSQFYAMPLQINPGFAGSSNAPRLGVAYRNQWSGFQNAYRTYAVFYEQSLDRLNSGIGFQVEGDNAGNGILRTTRFNANYAYRLGITDDVALKLGVEAGLFQTNLDWDQLVFPDQIDPLNGTGLTTSELRPDAANRSQLDISAGMLLLTERWYVGAAIKHINSPNEGILLINDNVSRGLPLRYTLHSGIELIVKKGNKRREAAFISPNFLFVAQGPYKQLNVGAYASVDKIFAGAWFRHTFRNADAAILMLGFRHDVFKIGLSYDLTVSGLAGQTGGTYELTVGLQLDQSERNKRKKNTPDINNCLKMFQ